MTVVCPLLDDIDEGNDTMPLDVEDTGTKLDDCIIDDCRNETLVVSPKSI